MIYTRDIIFPKDQPSLLTTGEQYVYTFKSKTLMHGISRAILHDPEVYQDPETFLPERFLKTSNSQSSTLVLDPDVRDPMDAAFGFGRRICPGRYMAYESMWITIASVLSVFNVQKAKGGNGQLIVPPEAYCDGFVRLVSSSARYFIVALICVACIQPTTAVPVCNRASVTKSPGDDTRTRGRRQVLNIHIRVQPDALHMLQVCRLSLNTVS